MLDAQTADGMLQSIDARHFRTRQDWATKAGERPPPGAVFKSPSRSRLPGLSAHTQATLSDSALNGTDTQLFAPTLAPRRWLLNVTEATRRLVGKLPLPK